MKDATAIALARRRWDSPEALRQRIASINTDMRRLAAKRRELEAKLAISVEAATAK